MDWDHSDVAEDRRILVESLKKAFTDFGQTIQRIFSDYVPASIGNIYEATDDQHGNERMIRSRRCVWHRCARKVGN
jgi:hypothetical protein